MECLLLTDDLIFSQQVSNALGPEWNVKTAVQFSISDDEPWNLVVVDLNLARVDCKSIAEICARNGVRVCAIASHVHVAKIEAAKQAGIANVLTRGQVSSQLGVLASKNPGPADQ